MKVLITGATGLVGKEIVRLCLSRNVRVNYLTTRKNKIKNSDTIKGFYWNPANNEIDEHCIEGVDAIINLAGANIAKRWTASYKKVILESRIDSLRTLKTLLKKQKDHKVKTLVSASAIGIYPSSLFEYYTEYNNDSNDSFLAKVVANWELAADELTNLGLNVAKIRIGIVLSKNGGALPQLIKPIKMFAGAPVGSGEQWQSWIHITDLAELFLFAVKHNLEGVYNAVAPNPVTNAKLIKEAAKVLQKPLILPNVPEWTLKLVLGEMADILLESQRVCAKKIESEGFNFSYSNISGALNQLLNQESEMPSAKELVS